MIIIGISGKKRSGKTLMAEHIKSFYPKRCHIVAFADALKDEVCVSLNITREYMEKNKEDLRLILQGWGGYKRKHCGLDYWILRCFDTIYKLPQDSIVIIPDVRHTNEAREVLHINGLLFRVERTECDIDDQHASEIELDKWTAWDMTLLNDGSIEAFKNTINSIIKDWNIK